MWLEVPATRLAAPATGDDESLRRERKKLREHIMSGKIVEVREGGRLSLPSQKGDQEADQGPSIVVPPGKLAGRSLFWYENDPELYQLECQAMKRQQSPFKHFKLRKESDGRLSWLGEVAPGLLKGGKRKYVLLAVYDHNHPHNSNWGGSVRVYMLDPDLDELREQYRIPHLIEDDAGSVYLCTAQKEDVRVGRVTTSASSSLSWAIKWISLFELYLSDEITFDQFAGHI